MSRYLNTLQEKTIFQALPSSVDVDGTTFNASKIYENQTISNYPTITLNVPSDGVQSDIVDVEEGALYYEAILTVHILTKNAQGKNGAVVAKTFGNAIAEAVAGWVNPLPGDVRIFRPGQDIQPLRNHGQFGSGIFDYVLSITFYHS